MRLLQMVIFGRLCNILTLPFQTWSAPSSTNLRTGFFSSSPFGSRWGLRQWAKLCLKVVNSGRHALIHPLWVFVRRFICSISPTPIMLPLCSVPWMWWPLITKLSNRLLAMFPSCYTIFAHGTSHKGGRRAALTIIPRMMLLLIIEFSLLLLFTCSFIAH